MAYTYRYIPASMALTSNPGADPKDGYTELFQQTLNEQFYNASNWWTIEEETAIGSQEYRNIDVRIAHVINAETGLKLGDDWKTLLFKELNHTIELGRIYRFDNSVWVTVNIEIVKNLSATCTIRRCNNTLRWIDEPTGSYYNEPCVIEYLVKEPRDYATQGSPFITPGGFLHIITQFNERTNEINENQRFLFGNREHWTCYKVIGTGINDFQNTETSDNDSAKILTLDLIANFVNNELDDVVNGIADVYTNLYTIGLNHYYLEGSPGSTVQLEEVITYNGDTVDRAVEWESSNIRYATVNDGLVTFISSGSSVITCTIGNTTTSASCGVVVTTTPAPYTEIKITPNINYVLEGTTGSYSVYLYENNVQLSDTFSITCNGSNVPSDNYTFSGSSNSFTIKNILRDNVSYLPVVCTSGSYTKTFNVYLKGGWLTI